MFPGIPIVFMQVAPARLKGQKLWPGVTGITFPSDVRGTVDLAVRLNPDAGNAAVVAGDSEFERYWLERPSDELQRHADRLNVIELVGLPTDQLLQKNIRAFPHTPSFSLELFRRTRHIWPSVRMTFSELSPSGSPRTASIITVLIMERLGDRTRIPMTRRCGWRTRSPCPFG